MDISVGKGPISGAFSNEGLLDGITSGR